MKIFLSLLLMQFYLLPAVAADGDIKHVTVNDYLQHAAARAKQEGRTANNLIHESSPYLLQHAYNPVNWYSWGDVAFERARKENKPIFLSIGYSTCHWCHVMAHESFENKEIAELLNKYFVSIKVDREQRPDIDLVYMSATQLINGHGGWPMSVFLDNQLRPFHAATYYPPFASDGRKGFYEILLKIQELWQEQPELINDVATSITKRITVRADETAADAVLVDDINELALQQISESYEQDFGGFSVAPKFPRPGIFSFLNQLVLSNAAAVSAKDKINAQRMMQTTLDAMASGGIHDQVAGGFHRYSVDMGWQVPHFEKMLYDQALMVLAYNDFYRIDRQERYSAIALAILEFVSREMRSPDGGFYSALDADSEPADGKAGEKTEGAYYLWQEAELKAELPPAEFEFVKKYYQVKANGNIFSDPHEEFSGLNVLYIDETFRDKALSPQEKIRLESAKKRLSGIRYQRPRPHLDDKVITAWNGMMISALARSSLLYKKPELLQQAIQAADFIKSNLYDDKSGRLFRQYRRQKNTAAGTPATLSDYAWLIYGLLDIHETSNDARWLSWAIELQGKQDALFLDNKSGAYFESVADDSSLLFRSKSIYDGALPSANAIVLSNLRKLSAYTDKPAKKKALSSRADSLVSSFALAINQNPSAAAMLLAVELEHAGEKGKQVNP